MRRKHLNILLSLVIPCALSFTSCSKKEAKSQTAPTYPVMKVEKSSQTLHAEYSALIKGWQTVEIRPQISGTITDILINDGAKVYQGQVLFVIDQEPYKAAWEIADANVHSAEAQLSTAQLVLESNQELLKEDVVSEFDIQTAENDVAAARAQLRLAQAQEVNAANNFSYTEVKSPVDGIASMIPYKVGALVSSNISDPLVTVSDDRYVYAYFSMSESQVLDLLTEYNDATTLLNSMPPLELRMSNGKMYPEKGHLDAISGIVTENTGAISMRAKFPNPRHLLREGSTGMVIIPMDYQDVIVVPKSATFELQDRVYVYKVIDGRTSSEQIDVVRINNGKDYIVKGGLEVGDIIIAEGAGLLKENMEVQTRLINGYDKDNKGGASNRSKDNGTDNGTDNDTDGASDGNGYGKSRLASEMEAVEGVVESAGDNEAAVVEEMTVGENPHKVK